jgi:hypothetical protein
VKPSINLLVALLSDRILLKSFNFFVSFFVFGGVITEILLLVVIPDIKMSSADDDEEGLLNKLFPSFSFSKSSESISSKL